MRRLVEILIVVMMLGASLTTIAQDLPIVGISTIKETVNDRNRNAKGANFQVMLETQMAKVGRFKIMERARVDEILAEQGMNNEVGDGRTANGGYNIAGVDYLVYGSITKLGQRKSGMATGQFATASLITEMAVDIKVVDASTGEIRRAETAEVMVKSAGGMATGSFATAKGAGDPLADVQRMAAKKVASLIATSIFPVEVVKGGSVIYLNYGSSILDQGDILAVFQPGEELIDEATGLNLGSEEIFLGKLQVTSTTDKFSKAKLLEGDGPVKGDLVRILEKGPEAGSSSNRSAPVEKRGRKI